MAERFTIQQVSEVYAELLKKETPVGSAKAAGKKTSGVPALQELFAVGQLICATVTSVGQGER